MNDVSDHLFNLEHILKHSLDGTQEDTSNGVQPRAGSSEEIPHQPERQTWGRAIVQTPPPPPEVQAGSHTQIVPSPINSHPFLHQDMWNIFDLPWGTRTASLVCLRAVSRSPSFVCLRRPPMEHFLGVPPSPVFPSASFSQLNFPAQDPIPSLSTDYVSFSSSPNMPSVSPPSMYTHSSQTGSPSNYIFTPFSDAISADPDHSNLRHTSLPSIAKSFINVFLRRPR
ncbi:hypothetical protein BD410DRAFT_846329 [Rickenella mellea]|uniref:Uncharacterized protein n=1 Tax=Rickenella mellea TaxID=50990 RepID=A0A4Y7PFZ8_9AGAM|nr:hypothetical protein BD410DRAFT_846329 [Rickenella mellea]